VLVASGHPACAACQQHLRRAERVAGQEVRTLECFAGLVDSAVPVRHAGRTIGFLHTGQVRLRQPGRRDFAGALARLRPAGTPAETRRLEEAYLRTRVLTEPQLASVLRLLAVFARHLGALSTRAVVPDARPRSPQIARAIAFIAEHQGEDLMLSAVAREVGMSAFYFCKMFKQATGLTYTDYLAHVRVEKVKQLLHERGQRVSAAAFAAGFQSLSQFNRVFRRVEGEAPTRFRMRVQQAAG
jgi:AraC-like DNA-binding protein